MWDSSVKGFRLKKRNNGSRYTKKGFHKTEIKLTKILEQFYGKSNIITSYHPIWAISDKGVLFEYDIYIKSINILIEYNGIEHYKFVKFFHNNRRKFEKRKKFDARKTRLAKENGFQLIVFKYDEPMFEDYIINKIERERINFL